MAHFNFKYKVSYEAYGFYKSVHEITKRDYIGERVIGVNKVDCAKISKQFGKIIGTVIENMVMVICMMDAGIL